MQFNTSQQPTYDPEAVQPMRDELVAVGFEELLSPDDIDKVLSGNNGETVLIMVNSVCGCSAGSARPGVNLALQHHLIPDHLTTVFAGQEQEAIAHFRQKYLKEYPPSSPAIVLMKNEKILFVLHRFDILGKLPEEIAYKLSTAFDQECSNKGPSISSEMYAKIIHAKACGSKIPKFDDR